jgi:glycosyltransferase involved in cell wall biosynthesis
MIARMKGKRILMWSHGFLKEENGIKGFMRTLFYRLSDGMLLYGNRAKNILINKGFDPSNLYVVYNSLDYDLQCKIRDNINESMLAEYRIIFIHPMLPMLIYIGRLTANKKLDMLINAAKRLHSRGMRVNVLIVGDGPVFEALKKYSEDLGLKEYVVFYGACYKEEEIGILIRMSDVCVAPGEVGLTCMHSLIYGTPVITHDNSNMQGPEWEAIIPGETGDLYKYGEIENLSLVIETWLNKRGSKENIAKACQRIIDQYYNPHYQIEVINRAVRGVPSFETTSSIGDS